MTSKIKNLKSKMHFLLHRRRRGKIARLPESVREEINVMLSDGVPYATIIAKFGDHGRGLTEHNLSRWRKADHQDWLAEQRWLTAAWGLNRASQNTKALALMLHELDCTPISAHPDGFVRRVNLMTTIINLLYPSALL
jgi:hypothetical protein